MNRYIHLVLKLKLRKLRKYTYISVENNIFKSEFVEIYRASFA